VYGAGLVVLMFFFGLATGIIGKIKGSSFFVWFLVGFFLLIFGLLAALAYRFERYEPKRSCPSCGHLRELTDQVCTHCGEELYLPREPGAIPREPGGRTLAQD
jgi:hypothetical protein